MGCWDLPGNVRDALRAFLARVKELLGPETRVYLFGSFARGDWLVDSDVDLIVISPRLANVPWHERYPMLRKLMPPNTPTDILAYTPEEFERTRTRSTVIKNAETHWIELDTCLDEQVKPNTR